MKWEFLKGRKGVTPLYFQLQAYYLTSSGHLFNKDMLNGFDTQPTSVIGYLGYSYIGRKKKKQKMWGDTDSNGLSFFSLWLRRPLGFPGGTSGKEYACQCRRHRRRKFDPWVGKIPWRRKSQPAPVFFPGKFQRSLVGYSPWGHKELDTTEWLNTRRTLNLQFSEKSQ